LGTWEKAPNPLQLLGRQPEKSGASQELIPDFQGNGSGAKTSVHCGFCPLNSQLPPYLNSLPFKI
jgi:hypothetical protein